MSKKILPFPLVMKNGAKVRTIEDLRKNADIETIVNAYLDGKLNRWCKAFHYDNIPDKLAEVTEAMIWQIYETLGIPLEQADVDAYLAENASLQSEAVGTVSAEAEVVDCSDIKAKLTEYISSDINLDEYAIESVPIVNEEGQVNQYKVVIQNKTTKIYCSFFMPFTPTNDEEAKDKWSQNLYNNIANAMQKMKETIDYNNEDHSQNKNSAKIKVNDDFIFVEGNDTVSDFYICDHPVTQAEYESIMGYNPSNFIPKNINRGIRLFAYNPSGNFSGENNPVECVTWYNAVEYCNKRSEKEGLTPYYDINKKRKDPNNTNKYELDKWIITPNESANGYRLPTENEWEYAARGGNKSEGYTYSGSNHIDDVAWYDDNSDRETHPVKEKEPNELGIYDMSGNVWEWCWDWYADNRPNIKDYAGPSSGSDRACRGGCWRNNKVECEVSYRYSDSPTQPLILLGFRVVRSV